MYIFQLSFTPNCHAENNKIVLIQRRMLHIMYGWIIGYKINFCLAP